MSTPLPPRPSWPGADTPGGAMSASSAAAVPGQGSEVDPLTVFDPAKLEADLRSMTRIVLRPIGSPLPLGFFTVAIDSVLFSVLQWGVLPAADMRAAALIVFPAFVVQTIVGIFAFLGRDSIAATLMMSFATTWLIDALIFYVNPAGASAAIGIFFIVFAVFASFMLASALPKRALAAVLVVAVPRFLVAGIGEITGSPGVAKAGAVLGFLLAAVAMYAAFALPMEDSRGREVLPIGRQGMARQATHGTLAIQLRDIERQAGVRRTL
jgi:succinate-acetate transporter protein